MEPREPLDPLPLPLDGNSGGAAPPPPICHSSPHLPLPIPDPNSREPDLLPYGQDELGMAPSPGSPFRLAPSQPSLPGATSALAALVGVVGDSSLSPDTAPFFPGRFSADRSKRVVWEEGSLSGDSDLRAPLPRRCRPCA
jgi:hypothetical protein